MESGLPVSASRQRLLRGEFRLACPTIQVGSLQVSLAIYGNGSENKMPGSGNSVLLNYEFCCRYLDGLAEFFTPSDEHTLIVAKAQPTALLKSHR